MFYLSSDEDEGEGEGDKEHTSASASAFASPAFGGTSPVALVSPHAPQPGCKIALRHSLVKGMLAHGSTDPGWWPYHHLPWLRLCTV